MQAVRMVLAVGVMLYPVHDVARATATDHFGGIWRNPKNSVHIRAEPCGQHMCGTVIWADEEANAAALKGSGEPLTGSTLFRNFRKDHESGKWNGKVYVPDMGKTFTGTLHLRDADHLEGRGCLIAGLLCKSQIWTRLKD